MKTKPDEYVEKKVAEFAKKITSCTHVDGFHTCVLDDKDDNETYKAVATDWLTTTLSSAIEEGARRERERMIKEFILADSLLIRVNLNH